MTAALGRREPLTTSEDYVDLTSGRYRFLRWGEEGCPVVVLLHGRTSLAETWVEVAERLADRYQVIAFEQRGHGGSPWDAEGRYNLEDFLGDYEEFIDAVVGGPHVLIGHSMGSCTALVYAARHPDLVTGLVLEDGGPPGPTVRDAVREAHESTPESFATWRDARAYIGATHAHMSGAALDRRTDLSVRPGPGGTYQWRSDVRALLGEGHQREDLLFDEGQWTAVERLTVPTVFLWAEVPPCLVEREVIDRMVQLNSTIREVTVASGHSIHEEALEQFLHHVRPFVDQHSTPRRRTA